MDTARPTTIAQALGTYAVSDNEIIRRYPGPSALVTRILGVLPNAAGLFEIWPPALVTYNLTVPALLDVPKCDMGLGISPELRAMVAHATSQSFGCQYCTAHTAIMGTLVRGPLNGLRISGRVVTVRAPGELHKPERLAVTYARAVATVPNQLTPDLEAAMREGHRGDRYEGVALVAAAMGYLNRFMDSLGTPLETAILEAVAGPLGEGGWDPGKHQPRGSATVGEAGHAELKRPNRLRLLREIPDAVAYEKDALAGIPTALSGQTALMRERLGFVPAYVAQLHRDAARRVLVHWLVERQAVKGVGLDAAHKHLMGWVHAKAADNHPLAAHYAFLAHTAGVDHRALQAALREPSNPYASPESTAMALAWTLRRMSASVPSALIEALTEHHSPASIIEMVGVLSIATGLQRLCATFPPPAYEPEIQAFVDAHGEALGLRPRLGA